MSHLIPLFLWVAAMSYASQRRTKCLGVYKPFNIYNVLLMLPLIALLGLRTDYNDTLSYIVGFQDSSTLSGFFSDPENYDLLNNPLFNLFTSAVRTATDNYHIYFMIGAAFVVVLMTFFFYKIADNNTYALTIFTYLALVTYFFALAAMKQTIAIAILCCSVLMLLNRKYVRFIVLVLLAGLFHTYAWAFLILLFLTGKPWRLRTFIVVGVTVFTMLTFHDTISSLLYYADQIGKGASAEMVFNGEGMNLFRVAVYALVPALSLLFRRILEPQMERKHHIMLHMSIVSFMFMLLCLAAWRVILKSAPFICFPGSSAICSTGNRRPLLFVYMSLRSAHLPRINIADLILCIQAYQSLNLYDNCCNWWWIKCFNLFVLF